VRILGPDDPETDITPEAYKPFKGTVQAVFQRALSSAGETDRKRAADRMGRLLNGRADLDDDSETYGWVIDLALFEPNERGVRPIDRFVNGAARRLFAAERDIANRISAAFFSMFTVTGIHENGGIWVEDVVDHHRRYWIVDLLVKGPEAIGQTLGVRIFDVGPFHAGIGPMVPIMPNFLDLCVKMLERDKKLPFTRSLAATTYGMLFVLDGVPNHLSGQKFAREVYDVLTAAGELPRRSQRIHA
jgi:hypothetical protein